MEKEALTLEALAVAMAACNSGGIVIVQVEHKTFSGEIARRRQQPGSFVTERCVLRLTAAGVELVEIAPDVDLNRDI